MKTTPRDVVAANVRAEMARRRVRQADMAAALDMSQQAFSRRLNGEVSFDIDELHAVAEALEVEAATLLGESA